MEKLSTAEQQGLRARAHGLNAVVMIGDNGVSDTVLKEIDRSLTAHELVKIRTFTDSRAERDAFLARICAELDAAPVQHIGKVLVLFRRRPLAVAEAPAKRAAKTAEAKPGAASRDRRSPKPVIAKRVASTVPPAKARRREV